MPPLLPPSPPLSKVPPDKLNTYLPLVASPATAQTSTSMAPSEPQLQTASPSVRPPFNPFFTLINDTATSTTHHPRNVHYIFSDDDPTLLTRTCLSALSASSTSPLPPAAATNLSPSSTSSTTSNPAVARPIDNRILLLDLSANGTTITSAHSLSSSWQIVSTSLTPAPTWDETSPTEGAAPAASTISPSTNSGFMLKIAGTDGRMPGGTGTGAGLGLGVGEKGGREGKGEKADTGMVSEAELLALMGEFEVRMRVLRTVVEAGGMVPRRQGQGEGDREKGEDEDEDDAIGKGEECAGTMGDI